MKTQKYTISTKAKNFIRIELGKHKKYSQWSVQFKDLCIMLLSCDKVGPKGLGFILWDYGLSNTSGLLRQNDKNHLSQMVRSWKLSDNPVWKADEIVLPINYNQGTLGETLSELSNSELDLLIGIIEDKKREAAIHEFINNMSEDTLVKIAKEKGLTITHCIG